MIYVIRYTRIDMGAVRPKNSDAICTQEERKTMNSVMEIFDERSAFSFEVFPPKTDVGMEK